MHKIKLLYSWFVHILLFGLPDTPVLMRFRGFCYGIAMKHCGRNFQVAHSALLNSLEKISVGDNVYIANYSSLLANGTITIGDNTLVGPNCIISSGNHLMQNGIMQKRSNEKPVIIGANSWIAANCTIVGGGIFPCGSVLAANSVWNSRIDGLPNNSLYGGTPARLIKKL